MSESLAALRRANPRAEEGFTESVEAVARTVRVQLLTAPRPARSLSRRRLARLSAAGAALAAVAVATYLTVGSPGAGPGLEDAAAAVKHAATLTAASAERSGTAVVRITHDGRPWAGTTIRWHGDDLSVSSDAPSRPRRTGSALLLVGGRLYGVDPRDGGWVDEGSPAHIDPGSGTTPAEYLAAVREDVGGVTLKRITGGMTALTTRRLDDGSTVYSGAVAAGLIARETGFKEGRSIRVLPFGYVAHDEAADPASPLDTAVTVAPEGVVRGIEVTWETWSYNVAYSGLGTTPALVAAARAKSLLEERMRAGKAAG
jgi:hypothetical protein